jgi:hypothetical protein
MQELPQEKDGAGKADENLEESSFVHACKTFSHYCETHKYGPEAWGNLSPIARGALIFSWRCEQKGTTAREAFNQHLKESK